MNDILKLREWLINPTDYSVGLSLYMKYKNNNKFDEFFNRHKDHSSETAFHMLREKLISIESKLRLDPRFLERKVVENAAKERVVSKMPTPSAAAKEIAQGDEILAQPEPSKLGKIDPATLPDHLAAAYERIQNITLQMGGVHAKLKVTERRSEAHDLLLALESLDTEKRNLWGIIDKHYKAPSMDIVVDGMTEEQLRKRIKNVKDSIRRIQQRIPKQELSNPKLAENSKVALEEKQHELELLEKKLDEQTSN